MKNLILYCSCFVSIQICAQDEFTEIFLKNINWVDTVGVSFSEYAIELDDNLWREGGFDTLEVRDSYFDYHIYKIINFGENKLVFVARTYVEENIHWLCLMNAKGEILDFIQIAYDNSEGFLSVSSHIIRNEIFLEKYDLYSEIEVTKERFLITKKAFKKVRK